jgi:tRNA-dihydrouridine synthase B
MSFKIGPLQIIGAPVILAPMAGVTDLPFRIICRKMGGAISYTEMLSDMALTYGNRKTREMLKLDPAELPAVVQLAGSRPEVMAKAAALAEEAGACAVDINMGCPMQKIVSNGEGSALMKDPKRAQEIIRAIKGAVSIPVTAKIRKGWDEESENYLDFSLMCQDAGVDAIAIHGRNRKQFYSGKADWEAIRHIKAITVIGNGDVQTAEDAVRMIDETGCDAVMIGQGALGYPWIFKETKSLIENKEKLDRPTYEEIFCVAEEHVNAMVAHFGERSACLKMRKHLSWYVKGLRQATDAKDKINACKTVKEMHSFMNQYLTFLQAK